jgi:hypothetical protein
MCELSLAVVLTGGRGSQVDLWYTYGLTSGTRRDQTAIETSEKIAPTTLDEAALCDRPGHRRCSAVRDIGARARRATTLGRSSESATSGSGSTQGAPPVRQVSQQGDWSSALPDRRRHCRRVPTGAPARSRLLRPNRDCPRRGFRNVPAGFQSASPKLWTFQ